MKIIEAIASIKTAIDNLSPDKTEGAWKSVVEAAGLVSQGDKGTSGIDETWVGTFGTLELRVNHTWKDTSKSFQLGPDRTRVKLELRQDGVVLDSHTNGYEV